MALADGTVYLLITAAGKYSIATIDRDGLRVIRSVPSGMWLFDVFKTTDGNLKAALASRRGGTYVCPVGEGKGKKETIGSAGTGPGKSGYLSELRALGNGAFLVGVRRQVYALHTEGWTAIDDPLRLGEKGRGTTATDIIDCWGQLYVCARSGIHAFDGKQWAQVYDGDGDRWQALAHDAVKDQLIAVGKNGRVVFLNRNGKARTRQAGDEDLWSVAAHQGSIYAYASRLGVVQVRPKGKAEPLGLPTEETPHNHCLAASSDALYYLRKQALHRYAGGRWEQWDVENGKIRK